MLDILMLIVAFLIFAFLVLVMLVMVCIYVAIKRGEDIHSDKVRDKYVDIATGIWLLMVGIIIVLYNN